MSFTVAIAGRPNVGKSTIFNRLAGKKSALVDNVPGLTRDRREEEVTLGDIAFSLIDTAGLEEAENETLEQLMMIQTEAALDEADIIFIVVDGRAGLTPTDEYFAGWIRKKNKPTILVMNKCEGNIPQSHIAEAFRLGFGEPVEFSAEHAMGLSELHDKLIETANEFIVKEEISDEDEPEEEQERLLQIAIAGRPNVGKSTLFNRLLRENRSIVSDVAGTTRDSVYVDWKFQGRDIRLVDTAGLRKRAKRRVDKLEKISVDDSFKAIQYANVVVLLLDATQALDKVDLTIADHILSEGRGLVIAANKWDLVDDKEKTMENIKTKLEFSLSQAKGVPVVTLSALEGKNTAKVISTALKTFDIWNKRISTGKLNKWLEKATSRHIPPLSKGRRISFKYATQTKGRPPTFLLFTSSSIGGLPDSYLKYLTNSLREEFGFAGVPIRISIKKSKNPYDR